MNTKRILSGILILSAMCGGNARADNHKMVELFCHVHENGKALDCSFLDGEVRRDLSDQDLLIFINKAINGAYLTVRSKKGLERTYQLDPNVPEFKRFIELEKNHASTREIGQAKLDIFGSIEQKVIKISDALDTSAPQADMVRSDPSIANQKFKSEFSELESEKKKLEKTCRSENVDKQLEAISAEKRNLAHYLSILLRTMKDPGSCTESFALKTERDGSVGLDQINGLSKLFQENCRKEKTTTAPACIAKSETYPPVCPSLPASAVSPKEASQIRGPASVLYQKLSQGKIDENSKQTCSAKYEQGPFVIGGASLEGQAICYGLSECGKGSAREKTRVTCKAEVVNGQFSCPSPEKCLKNGDILLFNKEIVSR